MIHEVDAALLALIEREATGTRDVEVVFDAPTKDWAGRRNAPTIDVYLYDIREDLRRRERGLLNEYDDGRITARHLPPRYFKLSYLVTAWTQRPEDEHRLLSSLLACFLRHEALPAGPAHRAAGGARAAGAADHRAAAARGPVVRRRLVRPRRRAQAVAGHRGQRTRPGPVASTPPRRSPRRPPRCRWAASDDWPPRELSRSAARRQPADEPAETPRPPAPRRARKRSR